MDFDMDFHMAYEEPEEVYDYISKVPDRGFFGQKYVPWVKYELLYA
jgi:hypothetical protein